MHKRLQIQNGSVTLVSLCFVAVLGIALAGYIAVCSRAMNMSNRTFQGNLSKQLAEVGIDEALRAFNKNDWTDWSNSGTAADWTVSGTTASCNLIFPSGKFGQGVTGSVKIRIDNYDANQLGSTWSSSANYRINDLVGYSGTWYRSIRNSNTNNTPGSLYNYWVQAPTPWTWCSTTAYSPYDVVNYNGVWYRCITSNTNQVPTLPIPATTYWVPIPSMRAWSSGVNYAVNDVVSPSSGGVYRCTTAHTSTSFGSDAANWTSSVRAISLSWSSGVTYTTGAMVYDNGTWYYCATSHTSTTLASDLSAGNWVSLTSPSASWTGSRTPDYYVGDYVYQSGAWYRCTTQHPSANAWNVGESAKFTTTGGLPYISWMWRGTAVTYKFNDVVFVSSGMIGSLGAWYRCKTASVNSSTTPSSDSTNWESALTGSMYVWSNSSINYNLRDVVYYSTTSQWYRCIRAHTSSGSLTPANTTYWSNAPLYSTAWNSNKQYSQNDTVSYNGQWYLALSSNSATIPNTNPGTWALAPTILAAWDSTKYYNLDDTVSYSGTWYRCILSHSAQTPTNTTYWSSTSGASYQWSASTSYTTSSYVCYGGVWYKCTTANTGQSPNNTSYWTPSWANSFGVTTGAPVVYAEGTITIANNPSARTQLRATIAPAPLFPNAAGATTTISANSGGTVDSYDGSVFRMDTAASPGTSGTYSTYTYNQNTSPFSGSSQNLGYSAVVAAGSTSGTAVTLSTTAVKGYLAAPSSSSSPYAPLYSSGGSVKGPSSPASPNIDLTRISRSPSIPQFDTLPSGGLATNWTTTPKGMALASTATLNLGTPGATTPSRYYYNGHLLIDGTTATTININGPVILYINGDLKIDGSTSNLITISSTGSAEIHIASGLKVNLAGNGFNNATLDPKKLTLICDTSASSTQNYSDGSNQFYGVIYIPNTTNPNGLLINNTNVIVNGAISANKITYSGANMNVHYDTSLRYATFGGVDQPYSVTDWRELPVDEQATMP